MDGSLRASIVFPHPGGPRDRDVPVLDRLPHYFERTAAKFGTLVEKEHAVMRERYFTRLWNRT
ncbi:MAG: hypothetical protein WB687_00110, partial [Candidatus Cybelea sp.]